MEIVSMKIGNRVIRMAKDGSALRAIDDDSNSHDKVKGKPRIVAYAPDGNILRQRTAQDVKEAK